LPSARAIWLFSSQVSGYAYKSTSIKDGVNQFNLQQEHDEGSGIACFQALVDFLCSLMSSNDDGTIIGAKQKLSRQPEESYLKFVMLYAKKYFQRYYTLTFCFAERICYSYLWVFVHYLYVVGHSGCLYCCPGWWNPPAYWRNYATLVSKLTTSWYKILYMKPYCSSWVFFQ